MPCSCSAINCTNRHSKDRPNIHFFSFPFTRPDTLQKWIVAIRRKDWYPTRNSSICSDHFLPEDFQPQEPDKAKRLRSHAVPSKFNFASVTTSRKKTIDNQNYQLRKKKKLNTKEEAKTESQDIDSVNVREESEERAKDSGDVDSINVREESEERAKDSGDLDSINDREESEVRAKDSGDLDSINEREESEKCAKDSDDSESLSSEEILKQKLEIMTAMYEKSQKKLKHCQEQCKYYVKQVIALEEVIDNLKQINSVTDYS